MSTEEYLAVHELDTPIGVLTLSVYDHRLCHLDFGPLAAHAPGLRRWADRYGLPSRLVRDESCCAEAARQISDYFSGGRNMFTVPLLMKGTAFQKQVWRELSVIPFGETRTYKDIACHIGNPRAVRAVGMANHHNPLPIVVPCHRVIGTDGSLTGYGGGMDAKRFLLELERSELL